MNISKNIPINAEKVINQIYERLDLPWNNGRINESYEFPEIERLYQIINSGIEKEDFFYNGDLFRIHSRYTTTTDELDSDRERIIGNICRDNSCSVLPITEYSSRPVAFCKSYDFTDKKIFYHVISSEKAVMFHANTQGLYGIDVCKLLKRFGYESRFEGEQEVLFPLMKEYVIKEYECTPNQFKYYMRNMK